MRRAPIGPTSAALLLAALTGCFRSDTAPPASAPAGAGAKSASAGQLNVYMWSEYIDPEIPRDFEARTGVRVRVDVYESTEEMIAKLQHAGGAGQYDVVVVSDHAIPGLVKLGLIRPLDHAKIPNRVHVAERFADPAYDRGNRHSLPYQWGTLGLMYRTDRVGDLKPGWAAVFDASAQPGPFVLIDSMRDMFAAALKFQGRSLNTRDPEEIKAAGELILAAKKSPRAIGFEGGVGGKNKVASGDAVLAIVYNGDALRAAAEDDRLAYVIPEEGTLIWVDAMTIPAGAPNPEAAHAFIDYILDPRVGARLSNFNQYATPNAAALEHVNPQDRANPAIYPPEEVLAKMESMEDVGEATRIYDEVWTAVKSR